MLISRDGSQAVQPLQLRFPLSPAATSFTLSHGLGRPPNSVIVLATQANGLLKVVHPAVLIGAAPDYQVTVATAAPFAGLAILS